MVRAADCQHTSLLVDKQTIKNKTLVFFSSAGLCPSDCTDLKLRPQEAKAFAPGQWWNWVQKAQKFTPGSLDLPSTPRNSCGCTSRLAG